jgi:abortive infection bacteriophage resistance protein
MRYTKPPVSIPDQIQKLKDRGLIIPDETDALRYFSNISYYRLRAYTYPYQDNVNPEHPFLENVSMEDIMALYTFDRKLRLLIFDAIEKIEVALRTQIIYQWSMTYGSHWHLDQKLYKENGKFIKHLASLQKEISRSNETFIEHYKNKYTQPEEPPCWMSLEVTSIGLLSLLFQNLKNCPEKKTVTHHFGLFGTEILENWVHNFCHIRNICAHHGRLWNRRIPIPITMPRKTKDEFINNKGVYPYKLYPSLCAMMYVLSIINPESTFKQQLLELLATCPHGQLKEMGFPGNWQNEKFWQI